MNQAKIFDSLQDAIEESSELGPLAKRVAKRRVKWNPFVRARVMDAIDEELEEMGVKDADGQVSAAFDWKEFFKLILPILLGLL